MSDEHPSNGSPKRNWLDKITQLFQGEPKDRNELVEVISDATDRALIDQETKDMIEGVLEIADLRVRDIMIPRAQMVTLEKSQPVETFLPLIIESGHSRFPVINEDKDHVEGILLAKDLLRFAFVGAEEEEALQLTRILRPTVIVPESKRVDRLLKEFRQERYHMAIVVDEFGGVSGLVTIEDILELIVGEIDDEFDDIEEATDDIRRISKRVFAVSALTKIDDFNDFFTSQFSDDEVETVGGLVMHAFSHLPKKGEEIELGGFLFKVMHADKRRLLQLQVKLPSHHSCAQSE
ncbi:MAG: CNNM family magnesium/cobalt transport protein CorC [Aeromonas sp.]